MKAGLLFGLISTTVGYYLMLAGFFSMGTFLFSSCRLDRELPGGRVGGREALQRSRVS